jgi:hypothetical protein
VESRGQSQRGKIIEGGEGVNQHKKLKQECTVNVEFLRSYLRVSS